MKRFLGNMAIIMVLSLIFVLGTLGAVNADDSSPLVIDFSDFDGYGFNPDGEEGTLDSNIWKALGLSDGSMDFEAEAITGDFARGAHSGGASTGGFYAWNVNGEENIIAAGWQPTAGDANPGILVMRFLNNTGGDVNGFYVSFDRWVNNDQDRSSTFDFGYQTEEPTNTGDIGNIVNEFTTPESLDALGFQETASGVIVVQQSIPKDEYIYLIWSTTDVGGSGSRDEFGISNISITPYIGEPSIPTPEWSTILLMSLGLLGLGGFVWFRRRNAQSTT